MKIQGKIFGLLILLLMFSCAKNEDASFEMADEESIATQAEQAEEINVERKLIKEGRVEFETDDITSSRKLIFESIEKYKGYTSSDQEYKSIGRVSNTIVIRVPAKNFDLLLKGFYWLSYDNKSNPPLKNKIALRKFANVL